MRRSYFLCRYLLLLYIAQVTNYAFTVCLWAITIKLFLRRDELRIYFGLSVADKESFCETAVNRHILKSRINLAIFLSWNSASMISITLSHGTAKIHYHIWLLNANTHNNKSKLFIGPQCSAKDTRKKRRIKKFHKSLYQLYHALSNLAG